ncbi:hypothetical protein EK21DRAFT_87369 [Setomelanomma holmii]|uniref:Uncharacterized protein n=1 Tax=Setomelanomma holmii TaxID=210430 RepID=A0A9P4HDX6_9PLEO|nr:hypothetical protein EK21DRAFT_87369 [Setomelanomma holmii]
MGEDFEYIEDRHHLLNDFGELVERNPAPADSARHSAQPAKDRADTCRADAGLCVAAVMEEGAYCCRQHKCLKDFCKEDAAPPSNFCQGYHRCHYNDSVSREPDLGCVNEAVASLGIFCWKRGGSRLNHFTRQTKLRQSDNKCSWTYCGQQRWPNSTLWCPKRVSSWHDEPIQQESNYAIWGKFCGGCVESSLIPPLCDRSYESHYPRTDMCKSCASPRCTGSMWCFIHKCRGNNGHCVEEAVRLSHGARTLTALNFCEHHRCFAKHACNRERVNQEGCQKHSNY